MKRGMLAVGLWIAAGAVLAGSPQPAATTRGPTNDDCLTCHGDASAKRSNGSSVFVAPQKFASSVHGQASLACVDCHSDLAATKDFPHKPRVKKVECETCHDKVGASHPFHPQIARAEGGKNKLEVDCSDCHGSHEIKAVTDPGFRFTADRQAQACGTCHEEERDHFVSSEHGKALASGALPAPSCLTCHRKPVTAGSGIAPAALKRLQENLCLSCHLYDSSVRARAVPTAGFIASFESSVHGKALHRGDARAPNCVDCHGPHEERRGFDTSSLVNKMRVADVCGKCHAAENRLFTAGVHGAAIERGSRDAPSCTDCHGEHSILSPSNPQSPVAAANVSAQVCTPCHGSLRLNEKYNLPRDRVTDLSRQLSRARVPRRSRRGRQLRELPRRARHPPVFQPGFASQQGQPRENLRQGCHPGANARFAAGRCTSRERGQRAAALLGRHDVHRPDRRRRSAACSCTTSSTSCRSPEAS